MLSAQVLRSVFTITVGIAFCAYTTYSLRLSQNSPRASYDVIVIGGGHSGCEAATASARMGANTLLMTLDINTIGELSCNPSIGGIGKGQLVREIDALGGAIGQVADSAAIHHRLLNRSKGPAVRGLRLQVDRDIYKNKMYQLLDQYPNLKVIKSKIQELLIKDGPNKIPHVIGVMSDTSEEYVSKCVVLTTGTFLRGKCWIGHTNVHGGRFKRGYNTLVSENTGTRLSDQFLSIGFPIHRFKTGTPPRLDASSINYKILEKQPSETPLLKFSHLPEKIANINPKICCYKTQTNKETHKIIQENLKSLPDFESGGGKGIGPRYCPSLAAKVERFNDKESHTIWLEPEGFNSNIVFPNGLSGGFPIEIQQKILNSIKGLQESIIIKPGYDVEYDFIDPSCLKHTCESKLVDNLFLCGQLCGTTGYEEAAAMGLIAGANAALKSNNKEKFIIQRHEGYIGVLIDDLVTKVISEPYRMFSSLAEFRLSMRNDNADLRLTEKGYNCGLVGQERFEKVKERENFIKNTKIWLRSFKLPNHQWFENLKESSQQPKISLSSTKTQMRSAWEILSQPNINVRSLLNSMKNSHNKLEDKMIDQIEDCQTIEADAKYECYIRHQLNKTIT